MSVLIENKTDFVLRMFVAEKIAAVGILFSQLTSGTLHFESKSFFPDTVNNIGSSKFLAQ